MKCVPAPSPDITRTIICNDNQTYFKVPKATTPYEAAKQRTEFETTVQRQQEAVIKAKSEVCAAQISQKGIFETSDDYMDRRWREMETCMQRESQ